VFQNLYFLSDPAFRNFNFSDFWADSATGAPFELVSEQYIEARIRDAYAPDGGPPETVFLYDPAVYTFRVMLQSVRPFEPRLTHY
jgi:hypothetical protein